MRFTFFTAVSAALLLADTQTVFVQDQLYAQIEGEGHSSAGLQATAITGAEIEAKIQAEADADAELCARAAATSWIGNITKSMMPKWPKAVQNGWKKIVKGARGTNKTTMSKMIENAMLGQTPWESLMHDYTDHCAVAKYPLSLKDWFDQVFFY